MNTSDNRTGEIADLLIAAMPEMFETMLGMEMFPTSPSGSLAEVSTISAAVGFTGEVDGMVHLQVEADFAACMAARFLGIPPQELTPAMIEDAIGEMGNIIVGAVKSRLCDEGTPCVLTIPAVVWNPVPPVRGEEKDCHQLTFGGPEGVLVLDIRMGELAPPLMG